MTYLDYDPTDVYDPEGEVEPRCDICCEPEDHRIGWYEYDWNGETGNHLSCEKNPPTVEKECGS